MRLGVSLPSMGSKPGPERLAMVAREAETQGFHSVWVPGHVLRVFGPILDPLTVLSFVAEVTESVGLGTSVLVVLPPPAHPVRHAGSFIHPGPVSCLSALAAECLIR